MLSLSSATSLLLVVASVALAAPTSSVLPDANATSTASVGTTTTTSAAAAADASATALLPTPATSAAASDGAVGSGPPIAQSSPAWLTHVTPLPGNVNAYPTDPAKIPTGPLSTTPIVLDGYPAQWASPPTNSPEVQAVIQALDWSKVPKTPPRKAGNDGSLSMQGYSASDPDCWWSATGCTEPKFPGLPKDVKFCPRVGDWGLTYDDGPLTEEAGAAAEPELYNFLAQHKQKAGLFYIGSNVIRAPAAAQRALADGHTLCSHTWSHPAMTSQSNEQVVAELYWTLKAIKHVTGVTVKCWRPPYGDVDDRVRAIAWQMGMTTVLWNDDTNDWNMPGVGGGSLSPETVDGYFEAWIAARKNGTDNETGHIVLQHEQNNATVAMAEKWLPAIKEVFNVVPWNECMNVSNPYWEESFVYPTEANPGARPALQSSSAAIVPASTPTDAVLVSHQSLASVTVVADNRLLSCGLLATAIFFVLVIA